MRTPEYRYQIDAVGGIRAASGEFLEPTGRVVLDGVQKTSWLGPLEPCERDLLRVMASILDADRLSPRRLKSGPRATRDLSWQREIHLEIAVENPSRWSAVRGHLARLLSFMTDDAWDLSFADAPCPAVQASLPLGAEDEIDEIALFSGGLDSVAGLYARSLETRGSFVAVSACGNDVISNTMSAALAGLRERGVNVRSLKLVHQLRGTRRTRSRMESSQRSRGLLFLAMGAVTASRFGKPTFSVYETGVGCINLPMCRAQVAAQGTRAMHPRTLALFDELLRWVFDRPVRVVAPYFLLTKGELCQLTGEALEHLARLTMSCDEGDGHKPESTEHCGSCTSCLFRRIAIFSAGQRDPSKYRDHVMRRHGHYEQVTFEGHGRDLLACRSFADLVAIDPNVRFAARLPQPNAPASVEAEFKVLAMYQRYASEIATFLEHACPTLISRQRPIRKDDDRDLFAAVG